MVRVSLLRWLAVSLIWSGAMGLSAHRAIAELGSIQFIPPQTEEASDPRDRPRGGGSRPICDPSDSQDLTCIQEPMVALVPQSTAWGLSHSATPMIWFFSPYASEIPVQSSFELIDQTGQVIWQDSNLQLPAQAGIFSYQIPAQAELKPDETYRWYFTVQLDPEQPAADVLLSARLRYQTSPSGLPPSSPSSLERIQQLAKQGLWYDTLSELAQVSQEDGTQDDDTLWNSFLIQNGFSDLIQAPILSPINRPMSQGEFS